MVGQDLHPLSLVLPSVFIKAVIMLNKMVGQCDAPLFLAIWFAMFLSARLIVNKIVKGSVTYPFLAMPIHVYQYNDHTKQYGRAV